MKHEAALFESGQEGVDVTGAEYPDLTQAFSQFSTKVVPMSRAEREHSQQGTVGRVPLFLVVTRTWMLIIHDVNSGYHSDIVCVK